MQCMQGAGRLQAHCSVLRQCPTSAMDRSGFSLASVHLFRGARMDGLAGLRRELEEGYEFSHKNSGRRGLEVVCMAKERRVKMVSQQIKREISEMLLYDKVLQGAVLPETALGADLYLTAVATITDVEMSNDLSVAKVYISIFGDERGQEKAIEGLKGKSGYVRKLLAKSMNLKHTPEIRFIKDDALERGSRVIGILDKLKRERELKQLKALADGGDVEDDQDGSLDLENKAGDSDKIDDGDDSDWEDDENITFIK